MPFRWTLNPYRGCTHACEYCYARKYQRYLELNAGDDFSSLIFVKRNLPAMLARELRKSAWRREKVAVGTATDPYQPIEGHYKLTRACLQTLVEADTPFSIVTKGPMVVRDLDLLLRARDGAGCQVFMSVPTVDEDAWQRLEPGTAPPAQRLRAMRTLTDAGIAGGILMMPLVPGITTTRASVTRTIEAITRTGVRFVGANVARLDTGVREHFLAFLKREYPSLVEGYSGLYQRSTVPAAYGAAVQGAVRAALERTRLSGS